MKINRAGSSVRWLFAPFCASCDDVWPILLTRPERLFFSVSPSSRNVCQISPTLAEIWCVASSHARSASIVV